jgi:hypothetical protein
MKDICLGTTTLCETHRREHIKIIARTSGFFKNHPMKMIYFSELERNYESRSNLKSRVPIVRNQRFAFANAVPCDTCAPCHRPPGQVCAQCR